MRANPRTRIRPAARTYAHIRTYTRTRRKFSDIKSVLQHCQTEFHHQSDTIHFYYPITVQSISILAPYWHHHLYKPSLSVIIFHSFTTIFQLSANYSSLTHLPIRFPSHHNPPSSRARHIPSLSDFHSNQLTILSICQYIIKPCQFSICLPHSHLHSHIQQFLIFHLPI